MNTACPPGSPAQLRVRSVLVADDSAVSDTSGLTNNDAGNGLLARLPAVTAQDALVWLRRGEGLVGWGQAARLSIEPGEDRFHRAQQALTDLVNSSTATDIPGGGLIAFGSFTFDPQATGSVLVIPKVLLGRRDGVTRLTTVDTSAVLDVHTTSPPLSPPPAPPVESTKVHFGDDSGAVYLRAVNDAVRAIQTGAMQKVVLARQLLAQATGDIEIRTVLRRLAQHFPDCYTFACDGLVGATPELLVRRDGRMVESLMLAGTAARGNDELDDAELANALLSSIKDRHEHELAVESLRYALQPLCDELEIAVEPFLLRLANVQHLATRAHGQLRDEKSVLDLVAALHPTAAVCGTPTRVALDLIRSLEHIDRGRYSGPVGWIDSTGNGEWGIALRCAEISGDKARLFAGGGIVADSVPEIELQETEAKFAAMRYALAGKAAVIRKETVTTSARLPTSSPWPRDPLR